MNFACVASGDNIKSSYDHDMVSWLLKLIKVDLAYLSACGKHL